jgi:hypothetical protein
MATCAPVQGPLFTAEDASVVLPPSWPSAANTGVPAGVVLTPQTTDLTIDVDDTVVEGLDLQGCLTITSSRVTLRNCRVRCSNAGGVAAIQAAGTMGLVVVDLEVDGQTHTQTGITCSACTIERVNIHSVNKGVLLGSGGVLRNSFIHDLRDATLTPGQPAPGSYGVQSVGGETIRVSANAILAGPNATGAVMMGADLGRLADVQVTGNVLGGGDFTVYAGAGRYSAEVTIENNRVVRDARRGPKSLSTGVTWVGNVWDDSGEAIP